VSRGCTTPKVIENIISAWEELRSNETDYDVLDGWEDLPEDSQSKIRSALAQGHVDDKDWKGVSEPKHAIALNSSPLIKFIKPRTSKLTVLAALDSACAPREARRPRKR
jgi:hypothetical protein